jgi:hypothetical protein
LYGGIKLIDLPLYALTLPLSIVLITSSLLYEISDYDLTLSQVELAVNTHKIADKLVNSGVGLVRSQEIVEGEVKIWPNIVDKTMIDPGELGVTTDSNILIKLGDNILLSQGDLSGEVYSVTRIVLYQGEPTKLTVSLSE